MAPSSRPRPTEEPERGHLPRPPPPRLTGPEGLRLDEVEERRAAGLVNGAAARTSRRWSDIVRANVLTRFNALLGGLLVVILVVGPAQDALFGIVLLANTLIGIVQELRAKRSLDRLALLSAPTARVVRDGAEQEVAPPDIVRDDVIVLAPGEQVLVDGTVLAAEGLEVDESLLTGESEPVGKVAGDEVRSGSFAVAGGGRYVATRVGASSYARTLAEEARRFTLVRSELRVGVDRILRYVTWLIVPAAGLLVSSQLVANDSLPDAVRGSVAGVAAMIPEGLVLLTSVAFAAGVVRLGGHGVLTQELAALEGLARVDVLCIDKTGTITKGELELRAIERLAPEGGAGVAPEEVLAALAHADPAPNATMRALAAELPATSVPERVATCPFSSARKWSGADLGAAGAWVLGAPDVVSRDPVVAARVAPHAAAGRRVLLLAAAPGGLTGATLPDDLEPVALAVLEERVRADAPTTLDYLAGEGIAVKVVSGDDPRTVAAVARRVGLAVDGDGIDGRDLPEDPADLAAVLDGGVVLGRVTPHQKLAVVRALQGAGHVVAMTGDGVNDVLALKEADLGIAMGSGSPASRAVAPLVLVDDRFAALPMVVAEGRRVLANVERVANLFVTKTVYATVLALAVGVARLPFPFLPRHLTVISALTIGVPGFLLALVPNATRARAGFVGRVLRFAVPAGVVAAAATFAGYALAREQPGTTLDEARTTATIVLFGVSLAVLGILSRPFTPPRGALVLAMGLGFVVLVAVPSARELLAVDLPDVVVLLAAIGVVALADLTLEAGWRGARAIGHWTADRRVRGSPPAPPDRRFGAPTP